MATLQELLGEYGLVDETPSQTKVASAQPPQKNEVEQVLENLGLSGAEVGVEKVANETDNKGENRMSLTGIYEELFGEAAPAAGQPATEKTAGAEEVNEATQLFGELTAHYFDVARGTYLDKVAGSVEAEGQGQDEETPMHHLGNNSSLTSTIGKPADPAMPVNHSASGGAHMQAMTGNTSPYSLKEMALKKAILKRLQAAPVGAFKD